MDESFENLLKRHRADLDVHSPPTHLEDEIMHQAFPKKPDRTWLWRAAVVTLLLVSSALLYLLIQQPESQPYYNRLGDLSEEYSQIEHEYVRSIEALQANLQLESLDAEEYGWLLDEMAYLDALNEDLKMDLNRPSDQEKLISMLLDYYEKKLKILRRLELEINRKNNEKNMDRTS